MKDEEDPYNCSTEYETDDDDDGSKKGKPKLKCECLHPFVLGRRNGGANPQR